MSAGEGVPTRTSLTTSPEAKALDQALFNITLNEERWAIIERAFREVRKVVLAEVAAEMLKDEKEQAGVGV